MLMRGWKFCLSLLKIVDRLEICTDTWAAFWTVRLKLYWMPNFGFSRSIFSFKAYAGLQALLESLGLITLVVFRTEGCCFRAFGFNVGIVVVGLLPVTRLDLAS